SGQLISYGNLFGSHTLPFDRTFEVASLPSEPSFSPASPSLPATTATDPALSVISGEGSGRVGGKEDWIVDCGSIGGGRAQRERGIVRVSWLVCCGSQPCFRRTETGRRLPLVAPAAGPGLASARHGESPCRPAGDRMQGRSANLLHDGEGTDLE